MSTVGADGRDGAKAMLSIGALARATGLSIETLRTWERRYGFPVPSRKPSGHRLYPTSSVPRLRRIAAALAQGHRAGEVVGASEDDLAALLGVLPAAAPRRAAATATLAPDQLLALVARFDGEALAHALNAEWGRLGPLVFLEQRVAPLVHAVGEAWATGRLEVRHEHFLAERVGDLLRAYRLPFEERADGPLVVLATLPGEMHALGLQMAALTVAVAGCRVCYVGTEVPIPELASVARDLDARAVGVSVSTATRGTGSVGGLRRLRRLLPGRIALWVGGEGAPRSLAGAIMTRTLVDLSARATALRA
jgi:methanogenic corrinoid protein MtbC1